MKFSQLKKRLQEKLAESIPKNPALLPKTPFHEFGSIFADEPAILPFCCPAPPAAWRPKSAFLPKITFRGIRGKSAENAISRFWQLRQPIDFARH